MLISEEIEIELSSNKAILNKRLDEKGYNLPKEVNKWGNYVVVNGTRMKVKTTDLPDNDKHEIEFLCDYCLEEGIRTIEKTTYQKYNSNKNKSIVKKDACKKCRNKKFKETTQIKYGVDNISQLDSVKKKKEKTFMEHYGVKTSLIDNSVKEKIKQTCIEKYGVDNVAKSEEIKERIKQH